MRKHILMACALMLISFSATADIKLSKYAKVYKGGEGAVVTFIPLSPKSEEKALIEVTGIDTELDGLILLYYFEKQGDAEAYKMKYDGSPSTRLRTTQGYWSTGTTLYLPDFNRGIELSYDEKASKKVDTSAFLKRYQAQEAKGVQKKLAVFDREKYTKSAKNEFMEKAEVAKTACGKAFGAEIVWDSVTDTYLQKYNFASYCGNTFSEMASLCEASEKSKTALNAKIDTVRCAFGDKLKLRIEGKTLNWTTVGDEPNQETYIRNYLTNEF